MSSRFESDDSVYRVVNEHQRQVDWDRREDAAFLQLWAERFNVHFKMHIPKVVLNLERLPSKVLGHFRRGHNGLGLEGEIGINARYLFGRGPNVQVLGTLLHVMLHAWQFTYGTRSSRTLHNKEFRGKARELGLLVNARGDQGYTAASPFKDLLRRYGIEVTDQEITPMRQVQPGNSSLKKWSCACTNVRVAVSDFHARCLKCGVDFVRQ
jgi:hypothetical protein